MRVSKDARVVGGWICGDLLNPSFHDWSWRTRPSTLKGHPPSNVPQMDSFLTLSIQRQATRSHVT